MKLLWLCLYQLWLWRILSNTVTLSANQQLNLDTGAVGGSSGDLLFTGTGIAPQGSAMIFNVGSGGLALFNDLTLTSLMCVPTSVYRQTPIGGSMLGKNDVFRLEPTAAITPRFSSPRRAPTPSPFSSLPMALQEDQALRPSKITTATFCPANRITESRPALFSSSRASAWPAPPRSPLWRTAPWDFL